jgi:hypothetical protein
VEVFHGKNAGHREGSSEHRVRSVALQKRTRASGQAVPPAIFRATNCAIVAAAKPAPKPLSMFTTVTPGEQLASMVLSAFFLAIACLFRFYLDRT